MLWFGFGLGEAVFVDFLRLYMAPAPEFGQSLCFSWASCLWDVPLSQAGEVPFLYQNAHNK